jgi:hypothetical protein
MSAARRDADEFYVGYLPLPWGHSRFLRVAVPAVLWAMLLVSIGVAWTQRDPGPAVWDDGVEREWTGVLRATPYPMIEVTAGDDAGSIALLVEQGKRGAQARSAAFDGRRVRVRGWRLERDGRRIIELTPGAGAIEALGDDRVAAPVPSRLGEAVVEGEIMDAKCFLGAMKPGDGVAHRACAILCLTGGIPPMLVSRGAGGTRYLLMTDEAGGPMPAEWIGLAGLPVRATGALERVGDVEVLRVRAGGVRRR